MAWSRLEPGFSRHVKRLKSGPVASWLWVCSIDYCTEFLTDGFLDEAVIPTLCPRMKLSEVRKAIDTLLAVKSWERAAGGYMVHGYLEHNPRAEQVEADRRAARKRYRRWKDKQDGNAVGDAVDNGVGDGVGNGAAATPTVSRSFSLSKKTPPTSPSGSKYGLQPDGRYRLREGMFNDCPEGKAGLCVRTEYLNDVPTPKQCGKHRSATAVGSIPEGVR